MNFKKPYNSKEFINFLGNFLPDDFEQTAEPINLNDLSFKPDRIKKVNLIGHVPSLENLHVYEIEHKSESDPRVTLSRETFRLMSNYGVKKALAVFYSQNSHNYRFSLATIDLKLEGSRVTKEYSNPRRYSFFLGPDAKIHTPTAYLITKGRIKDLNDLQNRFSIEVVTKEFFSKLSNWYFWALKNIDCPKDVEEEQNGKNIFAIRLITRLIFIWFMKQKNLIPENIFSNEYLKKILKDLSQHKSTYYKAILQNLFFATLNTPIKDRDFRTDKTYQGKNEDFMNHNVYRFHDLFINPENMKSIFNNIPFLNGGLFECLDRIEDKGKYIRIDGFSDREDSQANAPNYLFFSGEQEVDLSKDYGTNKKNYKVSGIIDLLETYNFTIDESTPVDVEIALDPELLGRVFENLLASYNPETATTARKATGSYYTPREIVDYMVTQSLKEYFKTKLTAQALSLQEPFNCHSERSEESQCKLSEDIELNKKLDELLSYDMDTNPFSEKETDTLINSVNNLKIIDPAVGSGAFPMGILQKLVLVLSKLDSHNEKWKQQQIEAIEKNITDVTLKKELIKKTEDNFKKNELDYGRKLYLIQNCIYGVDIQPIAIQIAKLRFFISLLVDEKVDKNSYSVIASDRKERGNPTDDVRQHNNEQDNFGIEPLPNLETKFVSANSLIGLETQSKVTQIEMEDPEIDELKNELKRTRNAYFSASYTKQKEKLRRKDKKIRQQLAVMLKENGYPAPNTEKIVNWDPYDSNKDTDWFDPEWMFGIKDGFDIAIGNPPYIEARNSLLSEKLKKQYQNAVMQRWNTQHIYITPGADLLVYFYEISIYLIKFDGIVTLITHNAWLNTEYGKKFQTFLLNNVNNITLIDIDFRSFETANINTIISIFKGRYLTNTNKYINIKKLFFENISSYTLMDKHLKTIVVTDSILKELKWGTLFSVDSFFYCLIELLKKHGKCLQEVDNCSLSIGQGLNLTKNYMVKLDELRETNIRKDAFIPILTADDGAPFYVRATVKHLIDSNKISKHQKEITNKKGFLVFNRDSTSKIAPILIMPRGLGRHFCCFTEGEFFSSSYVEIYDSSDALDENVKLNLWLFLNSSIAWLVREIFGRKNLGGGMLKAEAIDLKFFPIYFDLNQQEEIRNILNEISMRESMDTLEEIDTPEHRKIDQIIFDYLKIDNNIRKAIIEQLKEHINGRINKSKT